MEAGPPPDIPVDQEKMKDSDKELKEDSSNNLTNFEMKRKLEKGRTKQIFE